MGNFDCLDCGVDTSAIGEYYMLKDSVWLQVNPAGEGQLCIACVERRLDRPLSSEDFLDAPANFLPDVSDRMKDRLQGKEPSPFVQSLLKKLDRLMPDMPKSDALVALQPLAKERQAKMDTLDPKKAARRAYSQAAQISGMIAMLRSYDSYNAPEEDRHDGGKYAIGRLIALADQVVADDVLPKMREAAFALVRYADLLEVAALAIGDNPDWWKEDIDPDHWEGIEASIERAFAGDDQVAAARVSPTDFGIVSGLGVPYTFGRMVDGMIDPDNSVSIPATLAEALRGLGVAWLDLDADPKTVELSVSFTKATATLFDKDGNVVE